jgi:CubicO group peptidase (beta-lactamase class C family)
MTAALLHQLIRSGQVDIDSPVADHVASVRVTSPAAQPAITIRHLATHTAGLPEPRRYRDALKFGAGLAIPIGAARPTLAEFTGGDLRALAPPGHTWSYSNYGLALLGEVIAEAAGHRFEEHAREALFLPLGMQDSDFRRTPGVQRLLAVGHQPPKRGGGPHKPVRDMDIAVPPAGSGFTTGTDMAKYLRALLETDGATDALAPSAGPTPLFDRLWELHPQLTGFGLCWPMESPAEFDGHRVAWHAGQWPGFNSMIAIAPDAGAGIFLSMNTSLGGVAGSTISLGRTLLRRLLGQEEPDPLTHAAAAVSGRARAFRTRGPRRLNAMPLLDTGGKVRLRTGDKGALLSARLGPLRQGIPLRSSGGGMYEGSLPQFGVHAPLRAVDEQDRLLLTVNSVPMTFHQARR